MKSTWFLRAPSRGYSSAIGSFTLRISSLSAQTSSALLDDRGAGRDEVRVADRRTDTRAPLDQHLVTGGGQLAHARGRERDAVLVCLDLVWLRR